MPEYHGLGPDLDSKERCVDGHLIQRCFMILPQREVCRWPFNSKAFHFHTELKLGFTTIFSGPMEAQQSIDAFF